MPKPTAIVIWFDDNTCFNIDPSRVNSVFVTESAAMDCGHEPPYEKPGPDSPVKGPINNPPPPPSAAKSGGASSDTSMSALEGTCYYINGVIICP